MSEIVQYEVMRQQVAACARVDEAAALRDKAAALRLYAKQSKDRELQRWVSEIMTRATIKMGQLSHELPTAQVAGGRNGEAELRLPSGGKSKAETLAEAGITTSVAHRAEALAGVRHDLDDESGLAIEAMGVALETTETYFKQCREADAIPNQTELAGVVARTLDDRFGAPASPRPRKTRTALDNDWIDWDVAVKALHDIKTDPRDIVTHPNTAASNPLKALNRGRVAWSLLGIWIEMMEATHEHI